MQQRILERQKRSPEFCANGSFSSVKICYCASLVYSLNQKKQHSLILFLFNCEHLLLSEFKMAHHWIPLSFFALIIIPESYEMRKTPSLFLQRVNFKISKLKKYVLELSLELILTTKNGPMMDNYLTESLRVEAR